MNRMRKFSDEEEPRSKQSRVAKMNSLHKQLDELRNGLAGHSKADAPHAGELGQLAYEIVRSRQRRAAVFEDDDLFGEPAWDIFLALYVAAEAQQKLSVTGVCDVAGVPLATGLRWIEKLDKSGWVHRTPDPVDHRRFWVLLTERARTVLRDYLEGIRLQASQKR